MQEQPATPGFWKSLFDDFLEDDVSSLAAAIAYYTTLSLSPLVLLALSVLGAMYPASQEKFVAEVGALVGTAGEQVIRTIVESAAARPDLRHAAGWIGVALLAFGATTVFAQLQYSLNRIWDMQDRGLSGLWGFVRRRVLSVGVLLALLFLTMISFLVQTAVNSVPMFEAGFLQVVWWMASFGLYTALFAGLYRWLPDRRIPWLTATRGALITAAMFLAGRKLIGVYLGHSQAAGAFGPAGAVVIWLLWAYYTAMTFLFSAELLQALARHRRWGWWKAVTPHPPAA
jgi:membrane protein